MRVRRRAAQRPDMPNSASGNGATGPVRSKFDPRAVSVAFGSASFFLRDADQVVRVDVDLDVLDREPGPRRTRDFYRQRLLEHRRELARVAWLKYLAGLHRQEVRMLVVAITAHDLA
jgi:hypothetical protein